MNPLERAERFNALLDLLRDIGLLGKVCFAGVLFYLSMKWFGEFLHDMPTIPVFFLGVLEDFAATFLSVFDAGKS